MSHQTFITSDGKEFVTADGKPFKVEVEVELKKDDSGKLVVTNINEKNKNLSSIKKELAKSIKNYFCVGNSPTSILCLDTLSAGQNIADLPERKNQINHNTKYEVMKNEDGSRRIISLVNKNSKISLEISDIEKLTGNNKTAKKLFVFAIIKANEQAIYNGELTKDHISFSLKELVEIGFYKALNSARKGFKSGMDTLTSMKIKGSLKKSNTKKIEIESLEVLFTGAKINKNQCYIFFNTRINWNFLLQYFTILPKYYFKLSNKASDLIYYIFYLARQHATNIEKNGYFTISLRAIQHKLQLPNENGLNNPQRDIKDAIENAIEQIEEEHAKYYKNTELTILPVYNEEDSITDYLENGYLRIGLTGDFAKKFTEINQIKTEKIKAIKKIKNKNPKNLK